MSIEADSLLNEIKSFAQTHKVLCVLTLGLAVAAFSLGKLAGRAITWLSQCYGTTKKTDSVSREILDKQLSSLQKESQRPFSVLQRESITSNTEAEHKELEEKVAAGLPDKPSTLVTKNPRYREIPTTISEYGYISHKPYVEKLKKKYENQPEFAPFFKQFDRMIGNDRFNVTIENLTYRSIFSPNKDALELQAANYARKYKDFGVTIRVSHIDNLKEVLAELKKTYPEPTYVGIIVGEDEAMEGHVIPLLFHLGSTSGGSRDVSCVTLDVSGYSKPTLTGRVKRKLLDSGVTADKIISYEGVVRQADEASCRTGSVIMLCNAILSLKHNKQTNGFVGVFPDTPPGPSKRIYTLPAQWTYAEQIFSKEPGAGDAQHIRDLVSPRKEKSGSPRNVEAVRKTHKEPVKMKYTLRGEGSKYMYIDVATIQVPKEIEVFAGGTGISFELEFPVDTYLVRKARRRAAELEPKQKSEERPPSL